ncbi:diguanylate cyclase/phosphodiesterase with PAS/PAC sensor [Novosphingobium nitrogenifigens DSM 19370]|uniref:Diguanylate cyclase/phosphodiesterase with PAS/PAC sensor n=1 Tax=Novosphingobium nitrogenifigens DSM 19370 TaxID=983920 RepID=F1ZDM3_9SPHN|nr:EAL domain-containing protein [Novosphingobium nitrogenifigens]EGD57393.1 diguanylate cyclase/phosphodiesterase with PAS/PAC sensor [Novosphingobium nitrogenifigens DSM 19370]
MTQVPSPRSVPEFANPGKPALPSRLPLLAVLGLADPVEGDWARLRGLQLAGLTRQLPVRIMANALAAVLMIRVLRETVGSVWLVLWGIALIGAVLGSIMLDRHLNPVDQRRIDLSVMRRQASGTAALALVWAVPILCFGPWLNTSQRGVVWAIMALLIAGMGFAFAAVPLGSLVFGLVLGLAGIGSFFLYGEYTAAAVAACFVIFVAVGVAEAARIFLDGKLAEAGLEDKEEVVSLLLREFEEGEADWLWQIDATRRVRNVSPRFAFALGYEADDVEGKPLIQLIAGETWETGFFHPSLHDLAERLKRRESFSNLMVRVTLSDQQRWWELSASPRTDGNGAFIGFRGVGSDVTERRESEEQIAYLARFDMLTGLPNRMQLTAALDEAMRRADHWRGCCAFLMIDLDRFKAVNDTLGHLVGDRLLKSVADRLRNLVGEYGLCGRLGGDEFAIVLGQGVDNERVHAVADRVIAGLSQPYTVDQHTFYIGASVGSAIGPRDGATVETLMRNADLALYRAKDGGGGVHCGYEPSLHADAEERRQLEFALRHALERDEFSLVYQPVVDAETGTVVSFEALARWKSPELGPISPSRFVPIAEDTRLIVPIGAWALRTACFEAARWPDPIKIAINVSGEQLLEAGFADTVISALAASGLPPHRLEIEVTESVFLRDGTVAEETLQRIIALGCGVALDDFGTGYSSLGYLRKIRFSTIKVDRSFVQGAARYNPESLAIVRAVVAMADSLEMSTTAEGVETEEELAMVRQLGCRKIQGYYFGRPMTTEKARELVAPLARQTPEDVIYSLRGVA